MFRRIQGIGLIVAALIVGSGIYVLGAPADLSGEWRLDAERSDRFRGGPRLVDPDRTPRTFGRRGWLGRGERADSGWIEDRGEAGREMHERRGQRGRRLGTRPGRLADRFRIEQSGNIVRFSDSTGQFKRVYRRVGS